MNYSNPYQTPLDQMVLRAKSILVRGLTTPIPIIEIKTKPDLFAEWDNDGEVHRYCYETHIQKVEALAKKYNKSVEIEKTDAERINEYFNQLLKR